VGGAVVSDKHANFIVAGRLHEPATSCSLSKSSSEGREQFNVELELEIEVWQ